MLPIVTGIYIMIFLIKIENVHFVKRMKYVMNTSISAHEVYDYVLSKHTLVKNTSMPF